MLVAYSPASVPSRGYIAAKVARMRSMNAAEVWDDDRKRSSNGEEGVAKTCCIFFEPARWVRIEGHLMAADRSRCSRASHDFEDVYSLGEYPARKYSVVTS